jgi:hypothetical protein
MASKRLSKKYYQTGGDTSSAPDIHPDMIEIVQAVEASLQSGLAPQEVVLHLAGQGYREEEISFAFEQMGYDPAAITTIMQAAEAMYNQQSQQQMQLGMEPGMEPGMEQPMEPGMEGPMPPVTEAEMQAQMAQAASPQSNVGSMEDEGISKEELATALQRAASKALARRGREMQYGGLLLPGEYAYDPVATVNQEMGKRFYYPYLPAAGDLGGALSTAVGSIGNLFSGRVGADGLQEGTFRDLGAKSARFQRSKPMQYTYNVKLDPNDKNQYAADIEDMYAASRGEGKLRTKEQYQQDVNKYSRTNFNTDTGKYDVLYSSREFDPSLLGNKQVDPYEGFRKKSISFADWKRRMDPETIGLLTGNEANAPAGTTVGISPSGQASSYMNANVNPYYYNTMMGLNTLKSNQYKNLRPSGFPKAQFGYETMGDRMDMFGVETSDPKMYSSAIAYGKVDPPDFSGYAPRGVYSSAIPNSGLSPVGMVNIPTRRTPATSSVPTTTPSISPGVAVSTPKPSDEVRTITDPTAREPYEPVKPKEKSMMITADPKTEGLFGGPLSTSVSSSASTTPAGSTSSKPGGITGGTSVGAGTSPIVSSGTPGTIMATPPISFKDWYAKNASRPDILKTPNKSALEEMWKKETNQTDALTNMDNKSTPAAATPAQPEVTKKLNPEQWLNRQLQRPGIKAYGDVSKAVVDTANFVNEAFKERERAAYDSRLREMTAADNVYGTIFDNERGNWDERGLLQPDRYVPYMMPDQFRPIPGRIAKFGGQKDDVFNVDMKTLTQLIAAGADIEIL